MHLLHIVFTISFLSVQIYAGVLNINEESLVKEITAEPLWQAIFPGTKWCGDGDIAENFDDLGTFEETDKCCRAHDLCEDIIESGESKYGLVNTGKFTRLHCKCDAAFFDCLKVASDESSTIIGTVYFNGLGGQCFEENYPANCTKYDTIIGIRKRCIEYAYDTTQPKEWQWFDVPRYIFGVSEEYYLLFKHMALIKLDSYGNNK